MDEFGLIGFEFRGLKVQLFKKFVWIYKHFSPFCRTSFKHVSVTKVFGNQINIEK